VIWICASLLFSLYVWWDRGGAQAIDFLTGYIIEKFLSMDNLFVFMVIFKSFEIPIEGQRRILKWGIIGAVVLRGIFIGMGTVLIGYFSWILYVFGAFLIFTGIKILRQNQVQEDYSQGRFIDLCRQVLPVHPTLVGQRFFIRKKGKLYITPLLLTLIVIEFADIVFAIDSIPAIFAITQDPFIVYTSNIFAILGLRSLYLVLSQMSVKFKYLPYALSIILCFVGFKMLVRHFYEISSLVSLGIIFIVITFAVFFSNIIDKNKL